MWQNLQYFYFDFYMNENIIHDCIHMENNSIQNNSSPLNWLVSKLNWKIKLMLKFDLFSFLSVRLVSKHIQTTEFCTSTPFVG